MPTRRALGMVAICVIAPVLCIVMGITRAGGSTKPPGSDEPQAKPAQKKIAFEMRDKPWSGVLEWLADQSGLPVVASSKPTGKFTFVPPKGGVNSFTLDEIFDILNESLIEQRLILIRRTASFTIVPAGERIDPGPLPRSTIDELENLPRTQLTEVCLPIRAIPGRTHQTFSRFRAPAKVSSRKPVSKAAALRFRAMLVLAGFRLSRLNASLRSRPKFSAARRS